MRFCYRLGTYDLLYLEAILAVDYLLKQEIQIV